MYHKIKNNLAEIKRINSGNKNQDKEDGMPKRSTQRYLSFDLITHA
jgi:hypothetical protein